MDQDIINKQLTIKILPSEDARTITMIASTGSTDRDGDDLAMGNWILTDFLKNPVFLYCHNLCEQKAPIGIIKSLRVIGNEMWIVVYFPKIEEMTSYFSTPELIHDHAKFVDLIYNLYKCALLKGVSVGFTGKWTPKDSNDVWGGGRKFTEQTLVEISAAPVPCNPDALAQVPKAFLNDITRGGTGMQTTPEIKIGRRFSADSKKELELIHKEMSEAHNAYMDANKTYHKAIGAAHDRLSKFYSSDNEPENEPDENNDKECGGKKISEGQEGVSFLSLLKNTLIISEENKL